MQVHLPLAYRTGVSVPDLFQYLVADCDSIGFCSPLFHVLGIAISTPTPLGR